MAIHVQVSNIELGIPSSLVDTHDFAVCNEWNVDKSACYLRSSTAMAVRIPIIDIPVVKVAQGVPPGGGSFVAFQPWLVFSKKGDTLYIIPAALNTSTGYWEYYAVEGYEEVYILFIVIDIDYKEYAQVYDANFNLLINRAVAYMDLGNGGRLYISDLPPLTVLIPMVLKIIGVVGGAIAAGLVAWGWKEYAEAQKEWAITERQRIQAVQDIASAVADKVKQARSIEEANDLVAQILAVLGTSANNAQIPQSNSNDWWSNIVNWFKENFGLILGIIGMILLLLKINVIVEAFRNIIRSLRERL